MHPILIHSLDIIGAVFSFISTLFYIRASTHAWPASLIAISINIALYMLTGLYADTLKEGIYWASCILGWYWWLHGGINKEKLAITKLTAKHGLVLSGVAGFSICLLAFALMHFTNSQVPYWDATTTVLSLIAQWLICRKIIACWILWFIVDALYTGLYFYKGLPAHGILLIVYTAMAVIGYVVWSAQSRGTKYRSYNAASSVPDSGL